ncbi:YecA family protein [Candidatus Electrothrix sp.]
MLSIYYEVWRDIVDGKFSHSWDVLQDGLDCLRLIKRLIVREPDKILIFIENQLVGLEKLYPYKWFCSAGFVVDWFKCSICGENIDSFDCPHIAGRLYQGKMATKQPQGDVELDHVAIVSHPKDKRRLWKRYDDEADQYQCIRFLFDRIRTNEIKICDFQKLKFSKRLLPKSSFRKIGRNDPCYCGSGKKFKKCCVGQNMIEIEHIDIVPQSFNIEEMFS